MTEEQLAELRKVFGVEDEMDEINKSISSASKGSYEEEDTGKGEEDCSMLEKKIEELKALNK